MSDRDTFVQLLIRQSVKRGSFVLASGKTSTVYVDARLTTMHPEGMRLIGSLGIERIRSLNWKPDSIGGLTLGADPVSYAISYSTAGSSSSIRAFTVRKEPKIHGTGNLIEGPFKPGDHVVITEDVITTGKSALQAISSVEKAGGTIIGVIAIVDREDGGRETIQDRGYQVTSLTTITELTS